MRKWLGFPEPLVLPSSFAGRLFGLILCLILVGVVLIPSHAVHVWLTRDLALRWLALLLLGLTFLPGGERRSSSQTVFDAFDLLVLSGMGWFTLSAWNSEHPFDAFYALRGFWALCLLWFALRRAWRRWPEIFPWFFAVFVGTALMGSFWVVIEILQNHLIPVEGPFVNINFAAAFIGMAFVASWALLGRVSRVASTVILAALFLAWAMARSRGSLVALGFAAVVFILLHAREFEASLSRWSRREWLSVGVVVLGMLLLVAPMVNRLLRAGDHDPRAYWRVLIWQSSMEMASDHPLLGVGPGVYGAYYPYYRPTRVWFNENPFAHNEYLQAAAEGGWPAMVWSLVIAGLLVAVLTIRSRRKGGLSAATLDDRAGDAALLAILLIAFHSTLDFVVHEWCVVLSLMALVTFAFRRPVDVGVLLSLRLNRPARWVWILLAALGLLWFMGAGSLRDERAQRLHVRAIKAGVAGEVEKAEALERRALDFAPHYATAYNTLAYLSGYLTERAEDPAKKAVLFRLTADLYQEALKRAPREVAFRENQIEFFIGQRLYSRALDLQKRLLAEAPNHLPNYERLARILLAMRRPQEAVAVSDLAIQKKATYIPAVIAQVRAFRMMGREDRAIAIARRALETPPDVTEPMDMLRARAELAELVGALQRPGKGN